MSRFKVFMPDFSRCSRRMALTVFECTRACEEIFGPECVQLYSSPDGLVLDIRDNTGQDLVIPEAHLILKNIGSHGVFEYVMKDWNNKMRSDTFEFESLDELKRQLHQLLPHSHVSLKRPREYTNNIDVTDPDDRQRPYNPLRPSRLPTIPDHFARLSLRHMRN